MVVYKHFYSVLGDSREHTVPCICGQVTWNVCGYCNNHCNHERFVSSNSQAVRNAATATVKKHNGNQIK